MSIMDDQPKYARLKEWRKNFVGQLKRWYIDGFRNGQTPSKELHRWILQYDPTFVCIEALLRSQRHFPLMRMTPRKTCDWSLVNWRPIAEVTREEEK